MICQISERLDRVCYVAVQTAMHHAMVLTLLCFCSGCIDIEALQDQTRTNAGKIRRQLNDQHRAKSEGASGVPSTQVSEATFAAIQAGYPSGMDKYRLEELIGKPTRVAAGNSSEHPNAKLYIYEGANGARIEILFESVAIEKTYIPSRSSTRSGVAPIAKEPGNLANEESSVAGSDPVKQIESLGGRVDSDLKTQDGVKTRVVRKVVFDLDDKNVTDEVLEILGTFEQLQALEIADACNVSDAALMHLGGLTHLQSLSIGFGLQITDAGIEQLKGMDQLTSVTLTNTRIGELGFRYLSELPNLQVLRLCGRTIDNACVSHLKEHPRLETLSLTFNHISTGPTGLEAQENPDDRQFVTAGGLALLKEIPNLRFLFLRDLPITDAGLEQLESMEHLRELSLFDVKIAPKGPPRLRQALPDCNVKFFNPKLIVAATSPATEPTSAAPLGGVTVAGRGTHPGGRAVPGVAAAGIPQPEKRASSDPNDDMRTWTAKNGKQVEARYVAFVRGKVKLELESGRTTYVDINALSDADQEFVELRKRGRAAVEDDSKKSGRTDSLVAKAKEDEGYRVWKGANGTTIKAKLLLLVRGKVKLQPEDGEAFYIDVNMLSEEDQKYLEREPARKRRR